MIKRWLTQRRSAQRSAAERRDAHAARQPCSGRLGALPDCSGRLGALPDCSGRLGALPDCSGRWEHCESAACGSMAVALGAVTSQWRGVGACLDRSERARRSRPGRILTSTRCAPRAAHAVIPSDSAKPKAEQSYARNQFRRGTAAGGHRSACAPGPVPCLFVSELVPSAATDTETARFPILPILADHRKSRNSPSSPAYPPSSRNPAPDFRFAENSKIGNSRKSLPNPDTRHQHCASSATDSRVSPPAVSLPNPEPLPLPPLSAPFRHFSDPFPIPFCPTTPFTCPTAPNRLACLPKITKTRLSATFGNPWLPCPHAGVARAWYVSCLFPLPSSLYPGPFRSP